MNGQPIFNGQEFDDELVERYLTGDSAAFDVLYERYRKLVYLMALKLLNGDTRCVDDVFQKIWLKVIDKLPDYRREDKFKSWLMVLARNKILDEYRALRRSNEKFTSIDLEEGGGVLDCYSIDTTPPDDGALDAWHLLQKCGSLLSLEQREVLYGRMAGDSFKEIARRQNVSINTVLARMQYAVKKIKKIFSDIEAVEGGKNE